MKKAMMFVGAAVLALVLWLPSAATAKCSDCDKEQGKAHGMCLFKVKGAETVVTNTDNGATITITAKDPEIIKQIQAAAAKHMNPETKKCCAKDKDCDCPKCKAKRDKAKEEAKKKGWMKEEKKP